MVSRKSRVVLVAAVSGTAWVAGTAGASAAQSQPILPACDGLPELCDAQVLQAVDTITQTSTHETRVETTTETVTSTVERTRTVKVEPASAPAAVEPATEAVAAEPAVEPVISCVGEPLIPGYPGIIDKVVIDGTPGFVMWQEGAPAYVALMDGRILSCAEAEVMNGTDTTTTVGAPLDTTTETVEDSTSTPAATTETALPDTTVENNVEAPVSAAADATALNEFAESATEVAAAGAEAGVDVDAAEVADGTAAPEQVEVSGPAIVEAGDLPATGGADATLTMLGLAMVASGAAVRRVARD